MRRIIAIGGGGHVRVLIEAMASNGTTRLIGLIDNDESTWGTSVLGTPVLGNDDYLSDLAHSGGCDAFVVGMGAVSKVKLRKKLFEQAVSNGLSPYTVRHSANLCSPSADIAEGCHLLAQSFVNAGAKIYENVIINTAAIVEHDCTIHAHSHIAPRACLAGGVHVGESSHIGLGAVVRENLSIGNRAIVGAGAVVLNDVPDDTVVVGVPARPLP